MKLPRAGLVVLGAALALSMGMALFGWKHQSLANNSADPYYFSAMGSSLAHGRGFLPFGNMIHRRAPLYPAMIGCIYAVVGDHPIAVKVVQCLLFVGLCAIVMEMARSLFNERTAVIAGAACAGHPLMLRYVADFQLEILLTFLFTAALLATVVFYERPTIKAGAAAGLLFGLSALTKAVVIVYPVLFAAVLLILWRRRSGSSTSGLSARAPLAALATMFLVIGLTILPWTVRNYVVTHKVIPISTGLSDAFLRGYIFSEPDYALLRRPPYTDAEIASDRLFQQLARNAGTEWERDDVETDAILNRAAKQRLIADPADFARKFVVGLFTFWYEMTTPLNSAIAGICALAAWVFALLGWARCRHDHQPAWLLLMPVLYLNIALAALLALGRYAAPVTPALLVLAAYGADAILPRAAAAERPAEAAVAA